MIASLSLYLLLLASLGCHARPNSPSDPMVSDGGDQPVSRLPDIQQYLEALKHIPESIEDSVRQAEVKRRQMDLIRQQVYEALAPAESAAMTKHSRPCWGSLLTCLQAGIPHDFHRGSFANPAKNPPSFGHRCDHKTPAKPLRRPVYTTPRPFAHRHKNPCTNQLGCHHRILPTYVPIKFNKLPPRRITTAVPLATKSDVEKKQPTSTTQPYFTLPDKFYKSAFDSSSPVPASVKPKDLSEGSIKIENEILGITEKHVNFGLKTEPSIYNKHFSVTGTSTQSNTAKNETAETEKSIIKTTNLTNSDNDATTLPYNILKHTSEINTVLNHTYISNKSLINEGGPITEPTTTANQRTTFDEDFRTTQVSPVETRTQESQAEPNPDHLSPESTILPASEYTTIRTELREDFQTTPGLNMDYTSLRIEPESKNPDSPESTISFVPEYTTFRTEHRQDFQTTTDLNLDPSPKIEPESKNPVFLESTISPASELSTLREALDDDVLTTQRSFKTTTLQFDSRADAALTTETVRELITEPTERSFETTTLQFDSRADAALTTETVRELTTEPTERSFETTTLQFDSRTDAALTTETVRELITEPTERSFETTTLQFESGNDAALTTDTVRELITEPTERSFETTTLQFDSRTDAALTTETIREVRTEPTERSFETTTLQLESRTEEQIFEQSTKTSKNDLTTVVPEQEEITENVPFSQHQHPQQVSHAKERSAFSDLENDGVWKFTSELESYDDRFSNDETARSRRSVASELIEPHRGHHSSLSFTTKNNSIIFNASNIVELWPIIKEGLKNNAFSEDDKKTIRSIYGELGEVALAEMMEPEVLRDETSRLEEEDYEYSDSTEVRYKRSRKIVKLSKILASRLPPTILTNLTTSYIRSSRGKRSAGGPPASEAAAILALLAESGGAVQLDRADDEDEYDYEYYGYDEDDEYEDYEDEDREYDDNPSFKELIVLAKRHRKRKEAVKS